MADQADGAALFYTASTQPQTYTLLRSYLLHRLHSTSTSSASISDYTSAPPPQTSRFPFPHRANVLDRDAVMVPSGWDSWGKINVLRDGYDPAGILEVVERDLKAAEEREGVELERIWVGMIPDLSRTKVSSQTYC